MGLSGASKLILDEETKYKPSICWVSSVLIRKKEIQANMSDRKHGPEMSGAYKLINQSISNIKTNYYLWVEERYKYLLGCFVLYVAASFAIFAKSCLNP